MEGPVFFFLVQLHDQVSRPDSRHVSNVGLYHAQYFPSGGWTPLPNIIPGHPWARPTQSMKIKQNLLIYFLPQGVAKNHLLSL